MHLTTMKEAKDMSDTDTAKTADLAQKSGLFSSAPAQKPPSAPKTPKNTAKQPKQPAQTEKTPHNPPASDHPCDSTGLNLDDSAPNQPSISIIGFDLADKGSIFTALKAASKNRSVLWQLATLISDRYREGVEFAVSRAQAAGSLAAPPTREELIGIVSAALRAENATGSDVKGLIATLQSLLPDIFAGSEQTKRPDPAAIIGYICTFAGKSGAEICQDLGGRESLEARLSEILGLPVKLGDSAT